MRHAFCLRKSCAYFASRRTQALGVKPKVPVITFTMIEEIARSFPGTEVSTSYGTPAIKVDNKLILRLHQKEDAIVVLLSTVEEQQQLISSDPMAFYITDHYEDYPAVLVRPTIEESTFREVMEVAWRRVARKKDIAEYERRQQRVDA